MLQNIRQDYARCREFRQSRSPFFLIQCLLFENGFLAVLLYRLAHWFRSRRIPFFGPFFSRVSQLLTGVEIGPAAEIGPGIFISHGYGTVIGGGVRIGEQAVILHQVTLGSPSPARNEDWPIIGSNVFIGAGSKVIGAVTIGDDVFIGADALVTEDVPDGSRVFSTAGVSISPPATAVETAAVSSPGAGESR